MKFFSNEAKEENDNAYDRTDVATSDPVAVPQQRAGSPWNDTPGDSTDDYREPQHRDHSDDDDDEIAEQELRDRTDSSADSDTDLALDSDRDSDSDSDSDSDEPKAEHLSEPITTTYGPDGTVVTSDEPVAEDDKVRSEDETDEDDEDDEALKDKGTFDSPEAVEPATGEPLDSDDEDHLGKESDAAVDTPLDDEARTEEPVDSEARVDSESSLDSDKPVDSDVTVDSDKPVDSFEPVGSDERTDEINGAPVAVDPEPVPALATSTDSTDSTVDASADAAAVPVGATPGSVPEQPLDRLFADGDSFAERFRDIQLRFVDSPKEATAEAAALVGEAVDKITSALNSQKDALGGDSDDTEQLRVQLRGYRDLLNRLTGM